jgi:hypothetical protein
MLAELFCCEGVRLPCVNSIDGVVGEAFMVVNCCDVERRGCVMLRCCGRANYVVNRYVLGSEGLVGGAVSVEYDALASSEMSAWVMYVCHVGWTRVDDCVESLGSLRCRAFAGSKSVVLRMSIHVRNWRSEACGLMFGSLASIASVFRMCN